MILSIFYITLLLLSLLNVNLKNKYLLNFLFIVSFLFSCFRKGIGADFYSYYDIQRGVYHSWSYVYFEKIHCVFYYIGKIFKYDYMYFVLSSCFIFFFLYLIMKNYKNQKYTIFFFFLATGFYFYSFNGIRQFMALIVFLYAAKYINIKNKNYFILILFATCIHNSAIILFVVPLLLKVLKKMKLIYTIPTVAFCFVTSELFNKLFSVIIGLVPILNKYALYVNSEGYSTIKNYLDRGILVLLFIYIVIKLRHILENDNTLKMYFNIYFIGIVLKLLLNSSLSRISLFFLMIDVIFFSMLYTKCHSKNLKFILMLYCVFFYFTFIITNTAGIMGIFK